MTTIMLVLIAGLMSWVALAELAGAWFRRVAARDAATSYLYVQAAAAADERAISLLTERSRLLGGA